MNEDNLPRALKKLVTFSIFTIGALTVIFGIYLLALSFFNDVPYKFEGGVFVLLGVICMYLADQSILNTKRNDMLKEMIKDNQTLMRQQKGSGGLLQSLMGGIGFVSSPFTHIKITNASPDDLKREIDDFNGSANIKSENFNSPAFKKDVSDLMQKTNLSQDDAIVAVRLSSMSDEDCQKAMQEAKEAERYELASFIQKMLDERKKK